MAVTFRPCGYCHLPLETDAHPSRRNHEGCGRARHLEQMRIYNREVRRLRRPRTRPRLLRLGADYIAWKWRIE